MITRRRFLTISCAAAAIPAQAAQVVRWHGRALGADVSMELFGERDQAEKALRAARSQILHVEQLFSLYNPTSALSRLNKTGRLEHPHPDFLALLDDVTRLHKATHGAFDPTVQVLWQKHDVPHSELRDLIGWQQVQYDREVVQLKPGQQLTFNGIAQGFATDLVVALLKDAGFQDVYVDIGEQAALGRSRRLGIADPDHGLLGTLSLKDTAVATSSPAATPFGSSGHIMSPSGGSPIWSTISVIAPRATVADGLSTGLCLSTMEDARRIHHEGLTQRILLIDAEGNLTSLN